MPGLEYVNVVGRFGLVVGDLVDDPDENPNVVWCDSGEVLFTPLISTTKVLGADPVPVTLGHATIKAAISWNGYLTYSGVESVTLVDLTSADVNPKIEAGRATHRVEFKNVKAGGIPVNLSTFNARLAADVLVDGVVDLTLAAPLPSAGGVAIVRGPKGDPGPSTPAGVSFGSLTLSAGSPTVPELANVNEWTISGNVQVQLPAVADGSQFTVLVKSGFQGLTWPNGTQVLGTTDQSANVVVTLARLADGWTVFVSSPPLAGGSGAGLDTGWVTILAAYNLGTITWAIGSADDMGPGWGPGAAPDFGLNVKIRRTGNILHVAMFGLTKTDPSGSGADSLFTLPSEIMLGSGNQVTAVVPYHTASVVTAGLAVLSVDAHRTVRLYMPDGTNPPVGTILGRTSGSNVYGNVMMSFPIDPSSVWGT